MADPGFTNGGKDEATRAPRTSAVDARMEAPKSPRNGLWGRGVPSPQDEGTPPMSPLQKKRVDFGSQIGDFRCILDSISLQFSYFA